MGLGCLRWLCGLASIATKRWVKYSRLLVRDGKYGDDGQHKRQSLVVRAVERRDANLVHSVDQSLEYPPETMAAKWLVGLLGPIRTRIQGINKIGHAVIIYLRDTAIIKLTTYGADGRIQERSNK